MAETVVAQNPDAGKATPTSAPGVKFLGRTLYNNEDPNPDFQGRKGIAIYDEMIADPDVDSALARFTMPLESAEVTIEPPDDSDAGLKVAQWCRKWILCEGHPTDTWAERMEHSLMMFTYGFSAFEKILGPDGEGGQAWTEFSPILPQSVWEFRVDDRGHFEEMLQRAWFPGKGYREALVAASKVALFTFRGRGRNYWGRPLIRSAYKPYWHKHNIEILHGVAFERASVGFMHISLPDGATDQQIRDAENVATESRGHERGGAVTRGGVKIETSYPSGTPPDFPGAIRLYSKQIFSVMMADWEQLGASESGSRAVGGEKIGYALMAYQSVTKRLEAVWNLAIRQMTDLKYGPQKKYCTLKFQDLSKMKGADLAEFLAPLMADNVKAITRDPDLEQQIRKSNQLPPLSDADMKVLRQIHDATLARMLETAKNPPEVQPAPKPGETQPVVPAKKPPVEGAIQPTPMWRAPHQMTADGKPHAESFAEFDRMKALLESEPVKLWARVVPFRDRMIRDAATRLVNMSDADLRKGSLPIPKRDALTLALAAPLYDVYLKGREAVRKELAKQAPAQMQADGEDDDIEVSSDEKARVKDIAANFVVLLIGGLVQRGLVEAVHVRDPKAAIPKAEQQSRIETALRDVSDKQIQAKLAGAIGTVFANGREDQAKAQADEIETAYYSAVMDDGTDKCYEGGGTCAILDGEEHEPGDPAYTVPNPNCAWTPNCRCVNVYVRKSAADAA